jgi:GDP-L-fucose synthase
MKIFVTGGHGFLGTALVKKLTLQGHEIVAPRSKECDLTYGQSLSKYTEKYHQIYHLAAWTQAGDFCLKHPGEQWVINQKINTNILSWWAEQQSQAKMVFMGTSCAYAPASKLVEEEYMNGEPIDSLYTYAMTKRMLLQGARALQKQYGLKWFCAVPSTLYGPGYHTDGRQMHFIFDLIRKLLRGKMLGDEVVLWGDGYQRRELVYINDFVETLTNLNRIVENDLVNIGSGRDFSIREFAGEICKIIDYDEQSVKYDKTKYVGAQSKTLSIDKLHEILPSYRKSCTSLSEGLEIVVRWFESHPHIVLNENV